MKATEIVKLIDTTRCTACRGCQVACKQWNEMPGLRTRNFGSYQNPPDLQWNTWTLIRFQEHVDQKGNLKWLFRKDGCMHCTDAACVKVCPSGALYYTEFGTRRVEGRALHRLQGMCGGLPLRGSQVRRLEGPDLQMRPLPDPASGGTAALLRAVLPDGRSHDRPQGHDAQDGRKARAGPGRGCQRLRRQFVGGTHVLYILSEKPEVYDELPKSPSVPLSIIVWKDFFKPVSLLAAGGVLVGSFLHYLIHGPKLPDDAGDAGKKEGGE